MELLPLITAIINNSITSDVYPCLYRQAIVRPLLKKTGLDPDEYKNYRPVSNLFFISKHIEKAVSLQLEHYLSQNHLLDVASPELTRSVSDVFIHTQYEIAVI